MHDLHVWGLSTTDTALTAHLVHDRPDPAALLRRRRLYVLLDHHRADCNSISELWYTPSYTEAQWLADLEQGPVLALWLDGVGNPHNFGAILRSAAHFGVKALLLPAGSTLALSGAAARVAEGGAESVPLVQLPESAEAMAQLRSAGFGLAATLVEGGDDVFRASLPERLVYVMGAEGEGMDRELALACDLQVSIPGTGVVESLNVASATAVLLAAWRARQRKA